MAERIQKILAAAGLMSRRAAEEAILAGRVSVNGRTAALGERAEADDVIALDGFTLIEPEKKRYLMLHKPRGYVTTLRDEKGRKTVVELLNGVNARVYPVGRLDLNSEGLLLLTNDGDFANRVMHPSGDISKTYLVWVRGADLPHAAERLSRPIALDGVKLRPARVRSIKLNQDDALLSVTIFEGRNRQIRRMCESCELHVTRLVRVSEGKLQLGELPLGQWRELTDEEIHYFD
ncbi:MAG: rRNA pseudouridine synthase [Oscillospiraceae bacterium]|nr:rRNA pseudouridine synthase [Oscillospiraceae bacterium]